MMPTRHDQTLDLVPNNNICEAIGCFKKATIDIEVKVGQGKKITLIRAAWNNDNIYYDMSNQKNSHGSPCLLKFFCSTHVSAMLKKSIDFAIVKVWYYTCVYLFIGYGKKTYPCK
jgi:hypothetical protein